ncbi:MAG: M20/M25/M40 family metallo-hydrolase, partial [Leptospiraceae bacterium]|nr:M20/M25/M40 family metallo-hydrolase [Leptospiraceae bacterium]
RLEAGHAYNIIPDSVRLSGTVRAIKPAVQDQLEERLHRTTHGICEALGATARVDYTRCYPATVNTQREADLCARLVRETFGESQLKSDLPASMGSEDFAFMLQQKPGCYVRIGNGSKGDSGCMLHNPHYDFNDDILTTGATYWCALALRYSELIQAEAN